MNAIPGALGTLLDLITVLIGFGLIITIHELGHFLAARWAGIRVLAFAVGFGPALVSYRKGLGWRRCSSEPEYEELVKSARGPEGAQCEKARELLAGRISPTEYRLNAIPFGGYVKMLGQEDLNPEATSVAPDSYQNCKPWKRMVVISAGVIANVITAAFLFIAVFMLGLQTEPPKVGEVTPGSPAAEAVAVNDDALQGLPDDLASPGLHAGDLVLEINCREPNSFGDLTLAGAMARRGESIAITERRPGVEHTLDFRIIPETGPTGLLEMGFQPARTTSVISSDSDSGRALLESHLAQLGLRGVEPGSRLVRVGETEHPADAAAVMRAFRRSGGEAVELAFESPSGGSALVSVDPVAEPQLHLTKASGGPLTKVEHVLGLTPVLRVNDAGDDPSTTDDDPKQGLERGDVLARVGAVEYPAIPAGVAEIKGHKGKTLDLTVERAGDDGSITRVDLTVRVTGKGQVGFLVDDTYDDSALLALPPERLFDQAGSKDEGRVPPATRLIDRPGMRIVEVAGEPVSTLAGARTALQAATLQAHEAGESADVELLLELSITDGSGEPVRETRAWSLSPNELDRLHDLGWRAPFSQTLFELEKIELRADDPWHAILLGVAETHRVMMNTYITFARLFGGTVKVEHLKGPVGIAHLGTLLADRGLVWLMFFLALISVNLAVINFLPIPIVDGGQFLMLLYEQVRGRPVPIGVQNALTLAGLALIAGVFLIVTFNDVRALLGV